MDSARVRQSEEDGATSELLAWDCVTTFRLTDDLSGFGKRPRDKQIETTLNSQQHSKCLRGVGYSRSSLTERDPLMFFLLNSMS